MKYPTLLSAGLVLGIMSGSATAQDMPDGAIQPGTLANQQLMQDAMVGIAAKVGVLGCDAPETLQPYIMAMPEGEEGAQHWEELWMVQGCNNDYPVEIRFSEDGPDAANYAIE